jgi:vancomycin resistance protein YoaR
MNIPLILLNKSFTITFTVLAFLASMFFVVPRVQAALPETPKTDFIIEGLPSALVIPKTTLSLWESSVSVIENSTALSQEISPEDLVSQTLGLTTKVPVKTRKVYPFNPTEIYNYLSEHTNGFEQTKDAKLVIENNRATVFEAGQDGLHIDIATSTKNVILALVNQKTEAQLSVHAKKPAKPLAGTNTLGINELIGKGESNFKGSPKNRRHNIKVGVEKEKGVILAPGEEFSFNEYLGEVEASTGFLPELVIKKSGTVPEFGGGLCQVSSTTFRAAMDAGLPIVQRKNHSYAVQYYAPQGTDATIYPGVIDLKFTNDTPAHILIWPYLKDADNLVFEIYGTKDDREVILEKPVAYDRKSDGSMKAYWKRTVIKDGRELKDTFNSTYQSPALFHKKEEFPPTPEQQAANPQTQTPAPPVENAPAIPTQTPPTIN